MWAFACEFVRWFISRFPPFERHRQFISGVRLLVVVPSFDGVAGGVERLRRRPASRGTSTEDAMHEEPG